jgi:two-component system chemotaxis response regulator CheY
MMMERGESIGESTIVPLVAGSPSPRASKVLNVIRQEAHAHGAFERGHCVVTVVRREGNPSAGRTCYSAECEYRFAAASGGVAIGSLSAQAWNDLVALAAQVRQGVVHAADRLGEVQRISERSISNSSSSEVSFSVRHVSALRIEIAIAQNSTFDGAESRPTSSSQELPAGLARRKRILMVEDNSTFAEVVIRFLSRHEIEVVHELNGERAWLRIEREPEAFGLLVSDMHMPKMNGLSFLSRVRAEPRFRTLPVLLLTSDSDVELEVQALSAGADLVLLKSVDPRLLGLHIKRMLGVPLASVGGS